MKRCFTVVLASNNEVTRVCATRLSLPEAVAWLAADQRTGSPDGQLMIVLHPIGRAVDLARLRGTAVDRRTATVTTPHERRYIVATVDEKTGEKAPLSDRRLSLAGAAAVAETYNSLRHGDPRIAVAMPKSKGQPMAKRIGRPISNSLAAGIDCDPARVERLDRLAAGLPYEMFAEATATLPNGRDMLLALRYVFGCSVEKAAKFLKRSPEEIRKETIRGLNEMVAAMQERDEPPASEEQKSYLRGKRYNGEKKSDGKRGPKKLDQNDQPSTAQRIAKELNVAPATVRRDAQFAKAVDTIAEPRRCEST